MKKVTDKQFAVFVETCHRAARDYHLMQCSSGNMSWRMDAERMFITGTRTWLGDIRKQQVAVVRIRDNKVLNSRKPSIEAGFHAGVLRVRPDMNVVLHFQTPFATTLACSDDLEKVNFFVIPEIPCYIGAIAVVPYIQPGTEMLANAVIGAMKSYDMVVLRNHGMVTVGENFDDAIQKAVFFELACEIIVRTGHKLRAISNKDVRHLQSA